MPDSLAITLQRLGAAPPAAKQIEIALRAAYSANGMAYHNLDHIQRTLIFASNWRHLTADFSAVSLALWFHDIIYDPRAADNEAQSAAEARWLLSPLHLDGDLVERTAALILVTQKHLPEAGDAAGGLTADADLITLAASPAVYDGYSRAIRQEYDFVDEARFRRGRAEALQKFLDRPAIFFHLPIRRLFEGQARRNIAREIAALLSL